MKLPGRNRGLPGPSRPEFSSGRSSADRRDIGYFLLAFGVILYANFMTDSFTFRPYYALYPDTAVMYFLQGLGDNALFTRDLLAVRIRESAAFFHRDFLYFGVYRILTEFFTLQVAGKIISAGLCLACVVMVHRIGRHLRSRDYGRLLSSLFLVYFLSMDTFYGGSNRTFGIFLLVCFLSCLIYERFTLLPVFIPLAMLFYPVLSGVITISIALTIFFNRKRLLTPDTRLFFFSFLAVCLLAAVFVSDKSVLKPQAVDMSVFQNYKYSQNLEFNLDPHNLLHIFMYYILNLNEHSRLYMLFTGIFLAAAALLAALRGKDSLDLPRPLWILLSASTIAFPFVFSLHHTSGSRQFVLTLPLFLAFFVSWNLFKSRNLPGSALLAAILGGFVILHPILNNIHDYGKYRRIYDHMRTLPKDVLVAGHPESQLLDMLPVFSRRAVFYVDEIMDIYMFVYPMNVLRDRRRDLLDAIYARSPEKVAAFIRKYGIDYFIVERDKLKGDMQPPDTGGGVMNDPIEKTFLFTFAVKNREVASSGADRDIFVVKAEDVLNAAGKRP